MIGHMLLAVYVVASYAAMLMFFRWLLRASSEEINKTIVAQAWLASPLVLPFLVALSAYWFAIAAAKALMSKDLESRRRKDHNA